MTSSDCSTSIPVKNTEMPTDSSLPMLQESFNDSINNVETIIKEVAEVVHEDNPMVENETITSKESIFLDVCSSLIENPQLIPLPASWIPQVIVHGVKCIMWALWKPMYSGISKRVVLFHDMNVHVSTI